MIRIILFFVFLCFQSSCNAQNQYQAHPKREFRASWIVTLDNKDFPSKPGLSSEEQKAELIEILNFHHKQGMNAVIFQVRPAADAFYDSPIEPWSEWLSGEQGKPPSPYYDPLKFVIEECHKRNMELHAWFNPYRAVFSMYKSNTSINHAIHKHPDWFVIYAKKKHFNPGLPEVRKYVLDIVMDVVNRYDVDGIQFDDYFYPYRVKNEDFPDEDTYFDYKGAYLTKNDWRRDNVNQLIRMIHDSLQKVKPYVKFGISPVGIWRNKMDDSRGSNTFGGQTAYDYLCADVLYWLEQGWIDYVAPQLYWSIGHRNADYKVLADWWSNNRYGRHLYIGQAGFKLANNEGDFRWDNPSEMPNQLRLNRSLQSISGSIFFRAKFLMDNTCKISDTLRNSFYKYPALIPNMPWKDKIPPLAPENLRFIKTKERLILKWNSPDKALDGEKAAYYVIYRFEEDEVMDLSNAKKILAIQKERSYIDKLKKHTEKKYLYVVTAFDRLHNESQSVSALSP